MKHLSLILALSIIGSRIYAQQTAVVTKDRESYYEEYSVLVADKKIKHGNYTKLNKPIIGGYSLESIGNYSNGQRDGYWEFYYGYTNNIKEKGFYKRDVKDSIWVIFYPEGTDRRLGQVTTEHGISLQVVNANPVVCKTGRYKEGKFAGVWEYFDERGEIFQTYDHDKNSLTFLKNADLTNIEAGFIGGKFLLNQHLYDTYDFDGVMNTVNTKIGLQSGKIIFKFIVDEKGRIKDITEMESSINNKKLYQRALEVAQSLDQKWYPKVENGIAKSTSMKIIFDLKVSSTYTSTMTTKFVSERTDKGFVLVIRVE
jgi:antitoxin component YwqK of YwqJK toxin-antitoxin module